MRGLRVFGMAIRGAALSALAQFSRREQALELLQEMPKRGLRQRVAYRDPIRDRSVFQLPNFVRKGVLGHPMQMLVLRPLKLGNV